MNIRIRFTTALFGLLAACHLAFVPATASAQPQRPQYAGPVISGFDVQQLRNLTPGSDLVFTLYGTPGGETRIAIEGVPTQYMLPEVEPGVYVGSYTVRRGDRLSPTSRVTANLRLGNQVASVILDESLVAGAPWRSQAGSVPSGLAPRIEQFTVSPASRLNPGADLFFNLVGTPGGRASVRVRGVQGKIFLEETSAGTYQGSYTLRGRDRIRPNSEVRAELRVGDREVESVARQSLESSNATRPPNFPPRICANCGVVEAVNIIEVKGDGSYLGMIAGGLAGAVLGNQVGSGDGRTAARVLGAAGGAFAGREIERNINKNTHYEVVTRLESGGTQVITYPQPPQFKVGDRVRVEGNALVMAQ